MTDTASPSAPQTGRGLWHWLTSGTTARDSGRLEGFILRFLFLWVVLQSLHLHPTYPTLPEPVGIAKWDWLWKSLGFDLTALADDGVWRGCMLAVGIASIFYIFGIGMPLAVLVIAGVQIGIRTLNNSQGAPHHGHQIISVGLIGQLLVVWVLGIRRMMAWIKKKPVPYWARTGRWTHFWLFTIAAMTTAYVISVVTKLDESNGKWPVNSHYVAAQIVKTHRQNYYNALEPKFIDGVPQPATGDAATDRYRHPVPAIADWLRERRNFARFLFGCGLLLEAIAFFVVFGRWWALGIGWATVTLHTGIESIMQLTFDYNIFLASFVTANAFGFLILMAREKHYRPAIPVWLAAAVLEGILFTWMMKSPPGWVRELLAVLHAPGGAVGELFRRPVLDLWGKSAFSSESAETLATAFGIGMQVVFIALILHGTLIARRNIAGWLQKRRGVAKAAA